MTVLKVISEAAAKQGTDCHIVGGFLRDVFLGVVPGDADVVVSKAALEFGRDLADRLNGSFVLLDAERQICRVVLKNGAIKGIDIAARQAPSLEQDLRNRDLTVNALAVPLNTDTVPVLEQALALSGTAPDLQSVHTALRKLVIDPTGGLADLERRTIRVCSAQAVASDPLRLLRAVRFAAGLNWPIEASTKKLLTLSARCLKTVSMERVRDEIFSVLQQPNACEYVESAANVFGLLPAVWPEIRKMAETQQNHHHAVDVWTHCLATYRAVERILANLQEFPDQIEKAVHRELEQPLGRTGRTVLLLLKWVALFHDVGKIRTKGVRSDGRITFYGHDQAGSRLITEMAKRLTLSSREVWMAGQLVALHMRPLQLFSLKHPTRKAYFRLFRDLGPHTVEVLILALADMEAKVAFRGTAEELALYRKFICSLLDAYIQQPEDIFPPQLLTGRELLAMYPDLPKAEIGKTLAEVREAQAEGWIKDRAAALKWLTAHIENHYLKDKS